MTYTRSTCIFLSLLTTLAVGPLDGQVRQGEPHNFLRTQIGLSDGELRAMDDGKVIAKVLDTGENREVTIVGVARVRASTDFFLRMFRDIERFDTGASQIKKLSDPPRGEDFANMRIPPDDLKALENCSVDDCDMKLGAPALERIQREVDWKSPGAPAQAESIIRQRALDFVEAYLKGGNQALGAYRDKDKPSFLADEFGSLLQNSPYILAYRPELHRYLLDYPNASLDGATDFLYWAEYDFGAKPVIRLSHVTIYPLEEGVNASAIIAAKQIFFTHYFVTGLELMALVRDQKSNEEAFYVLTLIRERTDGVGGTFGRMLKGKAEANARDNVESYLQASQAAIEKYYQDELSRRRSAR